MLDFQPEDEDVAGFQTETPVEVWKPATYEFRVLKIQHNTRNQVLILIITRKSSQFTKTLSYLPELRLEIIENIVSRAMHESMHRHSLGC